MKRLLVASLILLSPGLARAGEATIAVAANFTAAAQEIKAAFEAATDHDIKLAFGSTGKLYAQIVNGAPFAAFLAADVKRPEKLEAEGRGIAGTRFTYAVGRIVLWSPTPGLIDGPEVLTGGAFGKLAIANPKTAPYGAAALSAMEKLGVVDAVKGRIVYGDSIAQTHQFVATGAADLGFVAGSQVAMVEGGSRWAVPTELYDPLEQQAVLVDDGNEAAKAFLTFLTGPQAHAIIAKYGYGVADGA